MSLGTRYLSLSLTIADGATTSNDERTGFKSTPVGVIFPASMTGTGITFEMSVDGGTTWHDVYGTDGNLVSVTKVDGDYRALNPSDFAGVQHVRVKSSGAETGAKIIKIVCRDVA